MFKLKLQQFDCFIDFMYHLLPQTDLKDYVSFTDVLIIVSVYILKQKSVLKYVPIVERKGRPYREVRLYVLHQELFNFSFDIVTEMFGTFKNITFASKRQILIPVSFSVSHSNKCSVFEYGILIRGPHLMIIYL